MITAGYSDPWLLWMLAASIVEQRDEARGEAAARQIMRREAAPTPLVLQFVENILRVAAIAIELAKAGEVFDERGGLSPR